LAHSALILSGFVNGLIDKLDNLSEFIMFLYVNVAFGISTAVLVFDSADSAPGHIR
jgi:hypothetical protein